MAGMSLVRRFWSSDKSLSLLLLSLSLLIFVFPPLQEVGLGSRLLITLFFSFILLSGVAAVSKNTTTTVVVGSLVVVSLTSRGLRLWIGGGTLVMSDTLFSSLFCITLAVVVMAQVLRPGPVTWYRIQGAVAFYLLLGLAWAFAYELVELQWPDAFSRVVSSSEQDPTARLVYFSFVTLTTVGYGDVTAIHPLARSLVIMEALTGQLFPAILLARLVSMELYYRQSRNSPDEG